MDVKKAIYCKCNICHVKLSIHYHIVIVVSVGETSFNLNLQVKCIGINHKTGTQEINHDATFIQFPYTSACQIWSKICLK